MVPEVLSDIPTSMLRISLFASFLSLCCLCQAPVQAEPVVLWNLVSDLAPKATKTAVLFLKNSKFAPSDLYSGCLLAYKYKSGVLQTTWNRTGGRAARRLSKNVTTPMVANWINSRLVTTRFWIPRCRRCVRRLPKSNRKETQSPYNSTIPEMA